MKKVVNIVFEDEGFAKRRVLQENGVEKIEYHISMGEGDKHYCDVCYLDGTIERIFRLDKIVFKEY